MLLNTYIQFWVGATHPSFFSFSKTVPSSVGRKHGEFGNATTIQSHILPPKVLQVAFDTVLVGNPHDGYRHVKLVNSVQSARHVRVPFR